MIKADIAEKILRESMIYEPDTQEAKAEFLRAVTDSKSITSVIDYLQPDTCENLFKSYIDEIMQALDDFEMIAQEPVIDHFFTDWQCFPVDALEFVVRQTAHYMVEEAENTGEKI